MEEGVSKWINKMLYSEKIKVLQTLWNVPFHLLKTKCQSTHFYVLCFWQTGILLWKIMFSLETFWSDLSDIFLTVHIHTLPWLAWQASLEPSSFIQSLYNHAIKDREVHLRPEKCYSSQDFMDPRIGLASKWTIQEEKCLQSILFLKPVGSTFWLSIADPFLHYWWGNNFPCCCAHLCYWFI